MTGDHSSAFDPWIEPVDARLLARFLGRDGSLFAADIAGAQQKLDEHVRGCAVCVVGAAGSIGSAFVKALVGLKPGALYLADISENALAHLVRDLRGAPVPLPEIFITTVVGLGDPGFARWFRSLGTVECFFNFAALKHVRSERDPFGLMRMISTNVFALEDFIADDLLPAGAALFSVSSDKAVSPTNLMGATKRWMERVIAAAPNVRGTSARFANVAFSAGSLPEAILRWLDHRQPIAAPNDVSRYFIAHQEAAQLCLLAGLTGAHGQVFAPKLEPHHAISMVEAAARILAERGLQPELSANEAEAKRSPRLLESHPQAWPCVFAPSDTSGEKDLEELWYADETRDEHMFTQISAMDQTPPDRAALRQARDLVHSIAARDVWDKAALVEAIRTAVPELRHVETGRSLDAKL